MTACCVNSYDIGNIVRLSAAFTDISGVPTDPSTVTLTIRLPDLTVVTKVGGDLTHPSTGSFYYDYTPPQSGTYYYRYAGTGVCTAAADASFIITASPVI